MATPSAITAKNIIEAAKQAGTFKTLLAAVEAAGLTETLKDRESEFTVFAPTDKAFQAVEKKALDGLLKPENKKELQRVLKHHVVNGRMDGKMVGTRKTLRPLDGGELAIRHEKSKVFIGDARITQTDVRAENGVIHVIDAVLMPTAKKA